MHHSDDSAGLKALGLTVRRMSRLVIYFAERFEEMGNKVHRLEPATYRAGELIRLVSWMTRRDGVVCPQEQRAEELARALQEDIVQEVATDHFIAYVQKGVDITRYANQLAAPLGIRLVSSDEGGVVDIPIEDEPLDAA